MNSRIALLSIFVLFGCCEDKVPFVVEKPNEEPPKNGDLSFTVVHGDLPDPPERFRIVSEAVYRLIKQDGSPSFQRYKETVPLSKGATFDLVPIRGGQFMMGSSPSDPHHRPNELPAHRVEVDSFWMASTETTWSLYQSFLLQTRKKEGTNRYIGRDEYGFPLEKISDNPIDMMSGPSAPYLPAQSGPVAEKNQKGNMAQPAVGMSRHSALKFCQWLTAQTGHFYRLPTEAEWEYACRAGTTTHYSFGDDPSQLDRYGRFYRDDHDSWFPDPVASRKANPWGLYDMHGNVTEWTLDAALADYRIFPETVKNPICFSRNLHEGVARGGDFERDPEELRSASRFFASRAWNQLDPRAPASIWYNSDALWLGFRVARPLKTPSLEEAHLIWNIDSGKFQGW